ncbi:MAG: glycosyltransferase family 39 protein [Elusimicrobia bacterium]|nr:glycosyltransferase family 39 protein [Elusimicrobiota bacterium]
MKSFIKNHFNLFAFIIFSVVIFGLYSNSLFFDWTFYDDDVLIVDKQDYLSFSNIKNILTDTVFGLESDKFCRPVLNLSFLFEKYLYGTNPFGYHLTNILLHLLCVFFLYLTLALRYDKKKTFVLCLLFAVHPVLVQAVSWIPGRNDTLLTLFIILSFYFLIKYLDTLNSQPSALSPKLLSFSAHILFFILALFTKETAILAPLFYIIFLFFIRFRRFSAVVLLYIIISAGYLFYRSFVLSYQTQTVHPYIFVDSFITSFPAVTKYIANILFPIKLTVFSTVVSADYILCALVFLIFVLLFLKFREYKYNFKIILFGFLWFLLFLVPTFILPYNQFYDHRIYLSLAGILLSLSEIIKNYNENFSKKAVVVLTIFFVLFSLISFTHCQKFKNRDVFWINALIDCPQSDIANSVVAGILVEKRAYALAEERYMKAISINKHSKHYVNLAVLYIKTGRFDDAEDCLLKAQVLDEYNPEVYYNLALVYKVKGNMEKAQYMKDLFIKVFTATNRVSAVPELKI